jgi:hypothetical protein
MSVYPSDLARQPHSPSLYYAWQSVIRTGPVGLVLVGAVQKLSSSWSHPYSASVTVTVPEDEYHGASGLIVASKNFATLPEAIEWLTQFESVSAGSPTVVQLDKASGSASRLADWTSENVTL